MENAFVILKSVIPSKKASGFPAKNFIVMSKGLKKKKEVVY